MFGPRGGERVKGFAAGECDLGATVFEDAFCAGDADRPDDGAGALGKESDAGLLTDPYRGVYG